MESKKDTTLFLFLALLYVCTTQENDCSRYPVKDLPCYNNDNNTITCEWNSTQQSDTVCTIYAKKIRKNNRSKDNASCELKSVDVSRPALKKCSMIFKRTGIHKTFTQFSIDLICDPAKQILTNIIYKSSCHIKLDPPQKPDINFTTVSWISSESRRFHLQWKHKDQSWKEASERTTQNQEEGCSNRCSYKFDQDLLIPDKRYEVRVRIKTVDDHVYRSVWSDWSPSASWVSPSRPTNPPSDGSGVIISIVACSVVAALLLAVIYLKRNKI